MLRKETIKDFLESLATLNPEDVEAYARKLTFKDYAPAFCDLAINLLSPLLDSRLSLQDNQWRGEMKKQLEKGWWEHTGNTLVEELLAYRRSKPPKSRERLSGRQ